MKPHPRIRQTIKWGGAATTALLVIVWIGSGGVSVSQLWLDRIALLRSGRVSFQWQEPGFGSGTGRGWGVSAKPRWDLAFECSRGRAHFSIFVPLWIPGLVAASVTAVAFRLDNVARRRARLNLCPKCHYNRAGLAPASPCPECGTSPTP